MTLYDDDLKIFESKGAPPLLDPNEQGYVDSDGAKIWYSTYGSGHPVFMLHGGLGNSETWGYQVPVFIKRGYYVILIDSRGHGRSTQDGRPFTYEMMAADVLEVMDALQINKAGFVGWSDGAIIALIIAMNEPSRVLGVFSFGCNMNTSGTKKITEQNPIITRIANRSKEAYQHLSSTPKDYNKFFESINQMWESQPDYSTHELSQIEVPVVITHGEHEEFIKREHAEYLAQIIPGAKYVFLNDVSHFAPLQRPDHFNNEVLDFLETIFD